MGTTRKPIMDSANIQTSVALGASWAVVSGMTATAPESGWYLGSWTGSIQLSANNDCSLRFARNSVDRFYYNTAIRLFSASGQWYNGSLFTKYPIWLDKDDTFNLTGIEHSGAVLVYSSTAAATFSRAEISIWKVG